MPRIAVCGGLRIGVDISDPNTPPFEIVNVPPDMSSIVSLPSRAFVP